MLFSGLQWSSHTTALSLHGSLTPQLVCLLLRSLPSKHLVSFRFLNVCSTFHPQSNPAPLRPLSVSPSEQHCTTGSVLWRPLKPGGEIYGSLPSMLCSIWAILSGKRRLMDVDGVFWCHQLFLSLMMIDPSVGMNDHLWEIRAPSRT